MAIVKSAIRVLLVDLPVLHAELCHIAFRETPELEIVEGVLQAEEASLEKTFTCDVALIGTQGKSASERIVQHLENIARVCPSSRSIVLAHEVSEGEAATFLRYGARGVLDSSTLSTGLLTKCIGCVARGELWATHSQLLYLLGSLPLPHASHALPPADRPRLTDREREVLCCLAEGLTNRQIAVQLLLSEHTVKNHLFRIFDKLQVSSRTAAVLYAVDRRNEFTHWGKTMPLSASTRRSKSGGTSASLLLRDEALQAKAAFRRRNA